LRRTLRYTAELRLPAATTAQQAENAITDVLKTLELADRAGIPVGDLSGGQRKRASIAAELLTRPGVFFLDEPTSGLDPAASHEVLGLIGSLRDRGITVFLTTHRLDEAERLCDRVAFMNTTLRTAGRPAELRGALFSKSLAVITAAPLADPGAVFTGLPAVESWAADGDGYLVTVSDPKLATPAVTRALVSAGADVLSITESRHSLEDVYLALIQEP
jgi:ABC-2 type transport system ATP-binding protein